MPKVVQEGGGEIVALPSPTSRAEDYRRRSRRSWTLVQKLAILNEAETCGDPVAVVARRHDMNANHLFMWMDQARRGVLGARQREAEDKGPMDFIDLGVVGKAVSATEPMTAQAIEIELPSGVRVLFGPHVRCKRPIWTAAVIVAW
jgi:transposase-like protein